MRGGEEASSQSSERRHCKVAPLGCSTAAQQRPAAHLRRLLVCALQRLHPLILQGAQAVPAGSSSVKAAAVSCCQCAWQVKGQAALAPATACLFCSRKACLGGASPGAARSQLLASASRRCTRPATERGGRQENVGQCGMAESCNSKADAAQPHPDASPAVPSCRAASPRVCTTSNSSMRRCPCVSGAMLSWQPAVAGGLEGEEAWGLLWRQGSAASVPAPHSCLTHPSRRQRRRRSWHCGSAG